jgi:hypothetical protein
MTNRKRTHLSLDKRLPGEAANQIAAFARDASIGGTDHAVPHRRVVEAILGVLVGQQTERFAEQELVPRARHTTARMRIVSRAASVKA